MFERIGLGELILIFAVIFLLFGANRFPEIARSLGKAVKEFKKEMKDDKPDDAGSK